MANFINDFFSFKGRIGKSTFFKRVVMIQITTYTILIACALVVGLFFGISEAVIITYCILVSPLVILSGVSLMAQYTKRAHDFDKGGIMSIFILGKYTRDGTAGPNKYGEDPLKRTADQTSATQRNIRNKM